MKKEFCQILTNTAVLKLEWFLPKPHLALIYFWFIAFFTQCQTSEHSIFTISLYIVALFSKQVTVYKN